MYQLFPFSEAIFAKYKPIVLLNFEKNDANQKAILLSSKYEYFKITKVSFPIIAGIE